MGSTSDVSGSAERAQEIEAQKEPTLRQAGCGLKDRVPVHTSTETTGISATVGLPSNHIRNAARPFRDE